MIVNSGSTQNEPNSVQGQAEIPRAKLVDLAEKVNAHRWEKNWEVERVSELHGRLYACIKGPRYRFYYYPNEPVESHPNADWVIWCLERLEELDWDWVLHSHPQGYAMYAADWTAQIIASTRAEAVANALFAALQATEQSATSAHVNPDSNSPTSDRAEGTKGEA